MISAVFANPIILAGRTLPAGIVARASFFRTLPALAFLLIASVPAQAQTPTDGSLGGTFRNEIERNLAPPALPAVKPNPAPAKASTAKEQGNTVTVERFSFSGNVVLNESVLARVVAPYLGRPVSFADLQNAASTLALAYRERGYVATVSLPRQEIIDGVVSFKIVEARFSGTVIDEKSNGRIHSELILSRIERALKLEKAVDVNALDRALLLINDLPGADVTGGLTEGENDGETRVLLQSTAKPVLSGGITTDNFGSLSTGNHRTTVDMALNSPQGRGEQYTLSALYTDGTRYGRAGFSLPLGTNGTRLGFSGSYLEYQVTEGAAKISDIHGTSQTLGLDLSHPLVRSTPFNVFLTAGLATKWFDNYSGAMITRQYRTDELTLAVNSNWSDGLLGNASNTASASLVMGQLDLQDQQSKLSDAVTTRANGNFSKLQFSLGRNQFVTDTLSVSASLAGQHAYKNLDSSEKFFLGGPSGVRAYPASEGGGSSGLLLVLEARKKLPANLELSVFHNAGQVRQNVNHFVGMPTPNDLSYAGYGASISWKGPNNLSISAVWSRRMGQNPNPNLATGSDQDGTKILNRYWLAASMSF
jgi:hemolysin activation/secretion protein